MEKQMKPAIYNTSQVAKLFDVSVETIHRWAKQGKIPGKKVGGKVWFFREKDILGVFDKKEETT